MCLYYFFDKMNRLAKTPPYDTRDLISIFCRASPGSGISLRLGRRLSDFRKSMVLLLLLIFWKLPKRHGDITIDEVRSLLDSYYNTNDIGLS